MKLSDLQNILASTTEDAENATVSFLDDSGNELEIKDIIVRKSVMSGTETIEIEVG
jgi:hypothetical protein